MQTWSWRLSIKGLQQPDSPRDTRASATQTKNRTTPPCTLPPLVIKLPSRVGFYTFASRVPILSVYIRCGAVLSRLVLGSSVLAIYLGSSAAVCRGTYEPTDARKRIVVQLAPEQCLLRRSYWRQPRSSRSQVPACVQPFDQPLRRLPVQIYCLSAVRPCYALNVTNASFGRNLQATMDFFHIRSIAPV